jgi:hypothetical protein
MTTYSKSEVFFLSGKRFQAVVSITGHEGSLSNFYQVNRQNYCGGMYDYAGFVNVISYKCLVENE